MLSNHMSKMPQLIIFFWNTALIVGDFLKVNGIFEWGNLFMSQGGVALTSGLRYSIRGLRAATYLSREINDGSGD